MLSVGVVSSASKAGHYFAQDNYYTQEESEQSSEWWGKTAEYLNLEGTVDPEQFVQTLSGQLPKGQQLGIMREGIFPTALMNSTELLINHFRLFRGASYGQPCGSDHALTS